MRPVHGLQILHRIPIVLDEDDSISARQIETETADVRRKQEDVDRRVGIEGLDDAMALSRRCTAVHAHVRHARHVATQQLVFDEVEHLANLTKDEDAMRCRCAIVECVCVGRRSTDTAVEKDLPVRHMSPGAWRATEHERTSEPAASATRRDRPPWSPQAA